MSAFELMVCGPAFRRDEAPYKGPSSAGPRFYPEQKTDRTNSEPRPRNWQGNIFPATLLGGLCSHDKA